MIQVRDRLSERLSKARIKLEAKRSIRGLVVLALAFAGAILGAGWILGQVAPTLVASSRTVKFEVATADGVRPSLNEVRMKGIPAGRITGVELRDDGVPVVTAELEKDFGPVYQDMQAELRPSSALEDMYIDIVDRGTKAAGEADPSEPLPSTQMEQPVNVNDVLAVFRAPVRERMRVLLDNLGNGLDDRGSQLQTAFQFAVPLLEVAGELSDQLAARKPLVKRLVHNTNVLTTELADSETELRTLLADGAATLSTIRDGAGDLDATLRELPPTLEAVDSSFTATRDVLGDVDLALERLQPVAGRLGPGLDAVRSLAAEARPAVDALQEPIEELVPLANALVPLAGDLRTALRTLRPQVPPIDRLAENLVQCEQGVQNFFHYDASMTKFGDSRGISPRGNLVFGLQTMQVASPDERAHVSCADGRTAIGGRPPTPEDAH